jgi:hypothetical protein
LILSLDFGEEEEGEEEDSAAQTPAENHSEAENATKRLSSPDKVGRKA